MLNEGEEKRERYGLMTCNSNEFSSMSDPFPKASPSLEQRSVCKHPKALFSPIISSLDLRRRRSRPFSPRHRLGTPRN